MCYVLPLQGYRIDPVMRLVSNFNETPVAPEPSRPAVQLGLPPPVSAVAARRSSGPGPAPATNSFGQQRLMQPQQPPAVLQYQQQHGVGARQIQPQPPAVGYAPAAPGQQPRTQQPHSYQPPGAMHPTKPPLQAVSSSNPFAPAQQPAYPAYPTHPEAGPGPHQANPFGMPPTQPAASNLFAQQPSLLD